jgi:hypothetical protein
MEFLIAKLKDSKNNNDFFDGMNQWGHTRTRHEKPPGTQAPGGLF